MKRVMCTICLMIIVSSVGCQKTFVISPRVGMTTDGAVLEFGLPRNINRTVGSWGVHEQWVYGSYGEYDMKYYYHEPYYLYFEDGILTSWQN